jgi:hypothetical protein
VKKRRPARQKHEALAGERSTVAPDPAIAKTSAADRAAWSKNHMIPPENARAARIVLPSGSFDDDD